MPWPVRGIYFFFETGEARTAPHVSTPRIVRVGTHAVSAGSETTLWDRLKQHRGNGRPGEPSGGGNHRGSVFRRHIGGALVRGGRFQGEAPATWGQGASPPPGATTVEERLEREVSGYVGRMPFLWLEADDEPGASSVRSYVERNAIGLLSRATGLDPPSRGWLGHHALDEKIRATGLWNVRHVGDGYDGRFLDVVEELVTGSGRVAVPAPSGVVFRPAGGGGRDTLSSNGQEGPLLALVSCAKSKAPVACRAEELYRPSAFFRMAFQLAKRVAKDVMILSAKHGAVRPGDVIAPYEMTLMDASRPERQAWAEQVHAKLKDCPEYQAARTILWFAGESYRGELLPLVAQDGKHNVVPMAGMRQGEQLEWLSRHSGDTSAHWTGNEALGPMVHPPVQARRVAPPRTMNGAEAFVGETGSPARPTPRGPGGPTADDFRRVLRDRLERAFRRSEPHAIVNAGELHRLLGGYPGPRHRMPVCCSVMRSEMRPGDLVTAAPPSGQGASLTILYKPR